MAEGRENPSRSFLSRLTRGDGKPGGFRTWVSENWAALFMLFFIFLLALFVRAYFAYGISQDNGYIVSGGSDSYYWRRIIDYSADTGKQLFWDPLTAYPDGIRNPRPPLYSMSVVVPGVITQNLFGSLDDAIGFMFVWSTAFWGALTVVPTYFLGKEVFGKRAGLVAAFFLAVMPSHVQRSVLSNADHDAIILFFIVLTFFFLLKAVKNQAQKRWVENWRSPKSIRDGFATYFRESKTAVLYALMAGTAFGTVIMIWVGFAYVAVLILAYFLIQVLFNRFRNIDSMSVMILIFIAMGFGFLLSYPVYAEQELLIGRFDVPVYLFLAAMFFGGMFVVSRDIPWTIVLPTVAVVTIVGVALISVFSPALGQAILSGQGYFVKSKLYSTIAEAQAPIFSELAMSFGMVTFFMSLIGLIWAIFKMPKKATNAEYIFIVVWLAAAIFMAISAARFMFNAAPAFAISSAWVLVIVVDRLDFNSARKSLVGGSGSPWQILKKSVKLRHVVGALFLAFMVVLPNVWYSVDAGIPSDKKQEYDLQIYESLPTFMRHGGYDVKNGTNWYLGAFGYQLPLPSYYFPAAWSWFSEQDGNSPPISRPAFVAWWDYGFEAIQEGQHPTVADNFQNGYQLTGNALMAQSETDAVALFAFRLLQTAYKSSSLKAEMHTLFDKYNVSVSNMDNILTGPAQPIIDEVLSDPVVYGPMASDLSDANARITAGRVELSKIGLENLVALYGEICEKTGWSIQYFMVDSRMFPLSGTSTGIFYAPAKLSDRRLVLGSTPVDFYTVKAVLSTGAEVDIDKVTPSDQVTDYTIAYTDMFYDSMFYRAMVGYSGSDVGKSNDDGIPGWSGGLYTSVPMPGWNLAHFKMVYRTAYFNPYPTDQIAEHPDAWSAMNIQDALDIKSQIDAGTRQGYVDQSAGSYYRAGAVFLKYYPGAIVNGTLTTEGGMPVAGVNVTVSDEFGIPHQITTTDQKGFYSVIAPQGQITLSFSGGSSANYQLIGSTLITTVKLNVTEDQAMRAPYDLDGNGMLDYYITKDVVMTGAEVKGDIFWDLDGDGNYTVSGDSLVPGATVYATDRNSGKLYSFDASQGSIDFTLPPGQYDFSATLLGRNLTAASQINVTYGKTTTPNLALIPSSLNGTLYYQNGTPAGGIDLVLTDLPYGFERTFTTAANGTFSFPRLLEGKYSLTTTDPGLVIFATEVALSQGQKGVFDATISEAATLKYRVVSGGTPLPYSVFTITDYYDPSIRMSGVVDNFGAIEATLPRGLWTLYVSYYDGSAYYAGSVLVSTENVDSVSGNLEMTLATHTSGVLRDPSNSPVVDAWMCFQDSEGARIWIMTDSFGGYVLALVPGTYSITSESISKTGLYGGSHPVSGSSANIQLKMSKGLVMSGTLWAVKDVNHVPDDSDLASYGMLKYVDDSGNMFTSRATTNGSFQMVFPSGDHVTMGLGDPGYSGWEQNATFTTSSSNIGIVAMPDDRVVTGFVTFEGTGLRNILVSFLPDAPLASAVTVMTGAGGFYSVPVPPSSYSVVIDQLTGPAGGEKYQSESSGDILPAGVAKNIDLQPVKRVEMVGTITGGGLNAKLSIEGAEQKTVETTNGSYSVYLLPGSYTIYSTSTQGAVQYANITTVDLSIFTRSNDIRLSKSHLLNGVVRIGTSAATKVVTISAESSSGPIIHAKSSTTGAYSLTLPNGDYTVSFLLEDLQTQNGRRLYVEYFGEAQVAMGSSDQTLSPTLQVRLDNTTFSGTVFASDGQPIQAFVELTASSSFGMSASFSTDSSGEFNASVQPGDYTVRFTRLQDNRVALSQITLVRNEPLVRDATLSEGRTMSGQVTASDVGVKLTMSVSSGDARLTVPTDESGSFDMIVPPGNYTMTASTTKTEKGMVISYSGSQKVTVDRDNVFVDFALTRSTRYGVTATWNATQEQSADPGVPVTYMVDITNTGNSVDSFAFSISSTQSGLDATFPGSGLIYDYGTNNKLTVPVIVTAKSSTAAGEAKVIIQVRSQSSTATRSEVTLFLKVNAVRGVTIYDLGSSNAVNSQVAMTKFSLNNTGNAQDNFVLNITNLDTLESLGWTAKLVDPTTGAVVPSVSMPAFFTTPISVKFTAIRENPDPTAEALVLAYSTNDPGVNTYSSIPVNLPDLSLGQGDLSATRSDLSFTLDTSIVAVDLTLVVIIVGLVVGIFYMRRKKGLGKSKTEKGGAKK